MKRIRLFVVGGLLALSAATVAWSWAHTDRLAHGSDANYIYFPSVSDDGNHVAYLGGSLSRSDLESGSLDTLLGSTLSVYLLDRSGGDPGTVAKISGDLICGPPRISRDGGAVAFFAVDPGTEERNKGPLVLAYCYVVGDGSLHVIPAEDSILFQAGWAGPDGIGRRAPPGLSNGQSNGSYWVLYQGLTTLNKGQDFYNPLVKWNPAPGIYAEAPTTIDLGYESNDPDLDAAPDYATYVKLKTTTTPGEVHGIDWATFSDDRLISYSTSGSSNDSNGDCERPSIDAAGDTVVYESTSTDLVSGISAFNAQDIYCATVSGSTWTNAIAYNYDSSGGDGASVSRFAHVSGNGAYISFESDAQNLATVGTYVYPEVWESETAYCGFMAATGSPTTLDCVSGTVVGWPAPDDPYGDLAGAGRSAVAGNDGDVVFDSTDEIAMYVPGVNYCNEVYIRY